MELFDLGCSALRAPYFESLMALAGYFGHGLPGSVVGLLLLAHGYAYDNQRTKQSGIATLAALAVAGLGAEILRGIFQWPGPKLSSSQGFPSGRSSAAFALAAVLTATFPNLGPIFYFLAVLTAISRMYFRAHFTWGVLGGAMIGAAAGVTTAHRLIPLTQPANAGPARFAGWAGVVILTIFGWAFFFATERNIRSAAIVAGAPQTTPALATLDFGTAQARHHLRHGWSADESWLDGKQSVVWADGLASELTLDLPLAQDYRFRIRALPYAPRGIACQTIEVRFNDVRVSKIYLEQGWHSYEFTAPKFATRSGRNSIQFFYSYAESPKSRGRSPDERFLSVAFDKLDVVAAP